MLRPGDRLVAADAVSVLFPSRRANSPARYLGRFCVLADGSEPAINHR
jgi:hypothetical protein